MTVDIRCRPIDQWVGDYHHWSDRRAPSYKASWNTIVDDLTHEMELLGATEATIGLSVARHQIRADGWPRADASIDDPVALVFDDNAHGLTLRYQCDRWSNWRGNLRAISLTLTRLRLVADAGVGVGDEAYRGFAELGAGTIALGAGMTAAEAARVLAEASGMDYSTSDIDDPRERAREAYRLAAKLHHPDVGGDHELWVRIEQAHRVLT